MSRQAKPRKLRILVVDEKAELRKVRALLTKIRRDTLCRCGGGAEGCATCSAHKAAKQARDLVKLVLEVMP